MLKEMMMSRFLILGLAASFLLGIGCSAENTSTPAAAPEASNEASDVEATAALAELSPTDQAAAAAQKICPVSDQTLGSMGTPIKVTVDGRDVFVCCEGCVDELRSKFDEYVAKLEK
jgi:hypothetical protein